MRVVLDANVLVAGLATDGICRKLVARCVENHEIVASRHILDEVRDAVVRKLRVAEPDAAFAVGILEQRTTVVEPAAVPPDACQDPDDLPVLGTAVACRADGLVTGDKALLALRSYAGIVIVAPADFWRFEATGAVSPPVPPECPPRGGRGRKPPGRR